MNAVSPITVGSVISFDMRDPTQRAACHWFVRGLVDYALKARMMETTIAEQRDELRRALTFVPAGDDAPLVDRMIATPEFRLRWIRGMGARLRSSRRALAQARAMQREFAI